MILIYKSSMVVTIYWFAESKSRGTGIYHEKDERRVTVKMSEEWQHKEKKLLMTLFT